MSHLVARVGDFFHFHPFASGFVRPNVAAQEETAAEIVNKPVASPSDDLAFFSMTVERRVVDRRADLDRVGLIGLGDTEAPLID